MSVAVALNTSHSSLVLACCNLLNLWLLAEMIMLLIRLDALAWSVIATATWLAGWVAGCPSQPVLYQND